MREAEPQILDVRRRNQHGGVLCVHLLCPWGFRDSPLSAGFLPQRQSQDPAGLLPKQDHVLQQAFSWVSPPVLAGTRVRALRSCMRPVRRPRTSSVPFRIDGLPLLRTFFFFF